LHKAGTVGPRAMHAIAMHAQALGPIHHSAETGSGKTTILFSHLSENHVVFALNDKWDQSVSCVKSSPLFRSEHVTFVEGPTQHTLPKFSFVNKLQIALIDGPHGYPFPDMEYFYFYPLIDEGGLLLVDDIQIPSIGRMFEIIKADDMFELIDIADNNLAFFRRTTAQLIDPLSDSWWLQGYNRAHYEQITQPQRPPQQAASSTVEQPISPLGVPSTTTAIGSALRLFSRITPRTLKKLIPISVKDRLRTRMLSD
jgi:Methyltransferase domain